MRCAREKSKTGIYHVMIRGINRQGIFLEAEDYDAMLKSFQHVVEKNKCDILSYCLMSNHVHLLLKEKDENSSKAMQSIEVSYAWWHNERYERVGHLFQNRYLSVPVEDEAYLLGVLRYIHRNPIKAGIVKKLDEYKWSSYNAYLKGKDLRGIVTPVLILKLFDNNEKIAKEQFKEFMLMEDEKEYLDYKNSIRKTDAEVVDEIKNFLNGEAISVLQKMDRTERNEIIKRIKKIEGASERQIARVTGLTPNQIFKA
mgnify:FL=1